MDEPCGACLQESTALSDLLPHPVVLIAFVTFVIGLVLGSVGAACLDDNLVGTTCTYTQSVILLSVGECFHTQVSAKISPYSKLYSIAEFASLILTGVRLRNATGWPLAGISLAVAASLPKLVTTFAWIRSMQVGHATATAGESCIYPANPCTIWSFKVCLCGYFCSERAGEPPVFTGGGGGGGARAHRLAAGLHRGGV